MPKRLFTLHLHSPFTPFTLEGEGGEGREEHQNIHQAHTLFIELSFRSFIINGHKLSSLSEFHSIWSVLAATEKGCISRVYFSQQRVCQ